jgi:hypothetical protein
LSAIAAEVSQDLGLGRKLYALGYDSQVDCMRKADDGASNCTHFRVDNDVVDERLVDLDEVKRELAQVSERGVPGTEVIKTSCAFSGRTAGLIA